MVIGAIPLFSSHVNFIWCPQFRVPLRGNLILQIISAVLSQPLSSLYFAKLKRHVMAIKFLSRHLRFKENLNLFNSACDCNEFGSLSSNCDPLTGQCPCKDKYVGRTCSQCKVKKKLRYDFGLKW